MVLATNCTPQLFELGLGQINDQTSFFKQQWYCIQRLLDWRILRALLLHDRVLLHHRFNMGIGRPQSGQESIHNHSASHRIAPLPFHSNGDALSKIHDGDLYVG